VAPRPADAPLTDLGFTLDGTYHSDVPIDAPLGYRIVLDGKGGLGVIAGSSPALTVAAGEVLVDNGVPFVQATDAPTIVVRGGHLTLRDGLVEDSSTATRAAVEVLGGTADLGTAADPGGNVLVLHSPGSFAHQAAGGSLLLAGNTYRAGGVTLDGDLRLEADPITPAATLLTVGGGARAEHIAFAGGAGPGEVDATLNGVTLGRFAPTGRLVAGGGDGDDDLEISGGVALPAWLYGEEGDDRLKAGVGPSVLFGGDGDDSLNGGRGRGLLLGGTGPDRLVGGPGDDLMIAGFTAYDAYDAALAAILDEWTSARPCGDRVKNHGGDPTSPTYARRANRRDGVDYVLAVAGNPQGIPPTAFDDGAADVLTGALGCDWFLLNLDGDGVAKKLDRVTDLKPGGYVSDLDPVPCR
jgi:hypothetical protein